MLQQLKKHATSETQDYDQKEALTKSKNQHDQLLLTAAPENTVENIAIKHHSILPQTHFSPNP